MPGKKRVTIVCENYWPEVASTAQLVTQLAEGLTAWFDVRVITGQPRYHGNYALQPRSETRNGVAVQRVWSTRFGKRSKIGRVINWLSFLTSASLATMTSSRRQTYLVLTNPPTAPWVTLLTRLRRQESFVLVYDLYPDLAQALHVLSDRSSLASAFDKLNVAAFRAATGIIALGSDMEDRLRAKLGAGPRIEVIPNWADGELISPRAKRSSAFARKNGLLDKTVFLYAGNFSLFQDLDVLIRAVELLHGEKEARLVFVGNGGKRPAVEAAARRSERVMLFDYLPYEQLSDLYAAADAGLIAIEPGVEMVNMPSKTYSILAAGRPFIAVADGSRELKGLAEEGVGIVVGNDPAAVAEAMKTIQDKPRRRSAMGKKARLIFEQRYTRAHVTRLYAALLGADVAPLTEAAQLAPSDRQPDQGSGGEAHARTVWGVSPQLPVPTGLGVPQRASDARQAPLASPAFFPAGAAREDSR